MISIKLCAAVVNVNCLAVNHAATFGYLTVQHRIAYKHLLTVGSQLIPMHHIRDNKTTTRAKKQNKTYLQIMK